MNFCALLNKAEKHRQQMEKALASVNAALAHLFDDDNTSFTYQPSDGWVVLFDDAHNAKVGFNEVDYLLSLGKADALDFLHSRAI